MSGRRLLLRVLRGFRRMRSKLRILELLYGRITFHSLPCTVSHMHLLLVAVVSLREPLIHHRELLVEIDPIIFSPDTSSTDHCGSGAAPQT